MESENEIVGPYIAIYDHLYQQMNPHGLAEVEACQAAQFLRASNLEMADLAKIWEMADYRKKGSLDRRGAIFAFKLVAALQQGHSLSPALLLASLNEPPKFFNTPKIPQQRSQSVVSIQNSSYANLSKSPSTQSAINFENLPTLGSSILHSLWDIDAAEQTKYEAIFYNLNPTPDGKLSGEQCRPVLLNSQLSQQNLAKIWELADYDKDGQMDKWEMCVALHLVYKCLQGGEHFQLPDRLPPSLTHFIKRNGGDSFKPRRLSYTSTENSPALRKPLSMSSRTSSIASLNNALDSTLPFKSIFEDKSTEVWPINVLKYETDFHQIDMDHDGLVNGADARAPLMSSGLPQQILAQIWSLVDTSKSGRLNLEQFALVIELTKECIHGIRLPESLPTYLIPPSIRQSNQAPSSDSGSIGKGNFPNSASSSSSVNTLGTNNTHMPPKNSRIDELNAEIEKTLENRRQAEQELFQLEADTTVKNSEIKNLEIELQTLTSTVKQLHHQKGEANKRLQELDAKIIRLEVVCGEQSERLSAEEDRLNKVKQEISHSNENFESEEEAIKVLRVEANEVEQNLNHRKCTLNEENRKIELFVDELTTVERRTDLNDKELIRIEEMTAELTRLLKKWEDEEAANKDEDSEKLNSIDEEILSKVFEQIVLNADGIISPDKSLQKFQSDPFKDDPFDEATSGFSTNSAAFGADASVDPFAPSTNAINANDSEFADFGKFGVF